MGVWPKWNRQLVQAATARPTQGLGQPKVVSPHQRSCPCSGHGRGLGTGAAHTSEASLAGHSSVISRGLSMITSRSLCRGVDLADSVRALRSKALASAAVSVSSERPRPF